MHTNKNLGQRIPEQFGKISNISDNMSTSLASMSANFKGLSENLKANESKDAPIFKTGM